MRAALPNNKFLNDASAYHAGLSILIVNAEVILKISAAISPVYGCAVAPDAFPQHFADRIMQSLSLFRDGGARLPDQAMIAI